MCIKHCKTKYLCNQKEAFTLVELSIVLVIIGLVVGGVFFGNDLIQSSKINSHISNMEKFKTATRAFKLKYGSLPGDISPNEANSLGFFTFTGANAGASYLNFINASLGSRKYGFGNNNGEIETGETYAFWQHLSEGNMIPGKYGGSVAQGNYLRDNTDSFLSGGTPVTVPSTPQGYDIFKPKSQFDHSDNHVNIANNGQYTKFPYFRDTHRINLFRFYATPYQQFTIDKKIDDGLPMKGVIRDMDTSFGWVGFAPCVTASPYRYDRTPETMNSIDSCELAILW